MKNFLFFVAFVFILSSCSEENSFNVPEDCTDRNYFPNLPPTELFHGYYDLLTANFSKGELGDCGCENRLAIQSFRNENLGAVVEEYAPNFMPMTFTCEELVPECEYNSNAEPEELANYMINSIDEALGMGVISDEEHEILANFFTDYFVEGIEDFDTYWCQIHGAVKSEQIEPELQGFVSAFVLTIFEMPYNYAASNRSYFGDEPQNRSFWRWLGGNLLWEGVKKYGKCMYTCYEGVRDNIDNSSEAIDVLLD